MCGDHMMSVLTHFIGIIQTIKAQYGIDLPGSLHTNKIRYFGMVVPSGIFLPPKYCSSGLGQWYI